MTNTALTCSSVPTTLSFSPAHKELLLRIILLIAKYDPALNSNQPDALLRQFSLLYGQPIIAGYDLTGVSLSESFLVKLSESNASDQLEDLLLLYDKQLDSLDRKKSGSFYTPVTVADLIIDEALATLAPSCKQPLTLDPACGSGIFLVRLIDRLNTQKYLQPKQLIDWLTTKVFAVDISPTALVVTWLAVLAKLWQLSSTWESVLNAEQLRRTYPKLIYGNFLLARKNLQLTFFNATEKQELHLLDSEAEELLTQDRFDLIIGNPPYGLSRAEQILPLENMLLKKSYSNYLSGKPNKYLLFMAQAFEFLSATGVFVFVTPNAWLGIKSADRLRHVFLEAGALFSIKHFEVNLFAGAEVEAVIAVIKKHSNSSIKVKKFLDCSSKDPLDSFEISPELCLSSLAGRIPLIWSNHASSVMQQIFNNSQPLSSFSQYFYSAIALQAYAEGLGTPAQSKQVVKDHSFHACHKKDHTYIPYLNGKDVAAYRLNWSGQYLSYGPWLSEPQKIDRFNGPRIVLREILGKFPYLCIGTYTEQTYLYNKSCLHILPQEKCSPILLKALLAILNSSLAGYIIRHTGCKSQRRLFPKLVNQDLKNFPLSTMFVEQAVQLADLVDQIMLIDPDDSVKFLQLRQTIDQHVLDIYGVAE